MALPSGKRLGPYEILTAVGAGGMGEVYRAKDTRLGRTVAIKVLAPHLSLNSQARQRFEQEARMISKLSHPHICSLHDIGQHDGIDFLVMEYVEGETLAKRIERGALPTEQALRYGIEIADAMDKAHRQGIVHRDLKPGNIMITKSGSKLLDFGLAKLLSQSSDAAISELSTRVHPLTEEGTVLGTVPYASPEQLEGKEADHRSDIFAFGAVLYEMTTGKKAFQGTSKANLIAAILSSEPPPISSIQPLGPHSLDHVGKKCLAKDPEERWQSMHDVASELRWISEETSHSARPAGMLPRQRFARGFYPPIAAILLLLAGFWAIQYFRQRPKSIQPAKFSVMLPENVLLDAIALSPDGQNMAFAGIKQGRRSLWIRSMESIESRELPITEGTYFPFWSPDSKVIGFFSQGKLKKIRMEGGAPQTICDVQQARGGTWNQDGMILFAPTSSGPLWIVPANGGTKKRVEAIDATAAHQFPYFLPDGDHFLCTIRSQSKPADSGIYVASLRSNERKRTLADLSNVTYAAPGYLVFVRENNLMAQEFDADHLQLKGEAHLLGVKQQRSWFETDSNYSIFSVSNGGTLVSGSRQYYKSHLTWFDRNGTPLGTIGEPDFYGEPSISPDERKISVQRFDPAAGKWSVWLVDLDHKTFSRFTFSSGHPAEGLWQSASLWSSDGKWIVFSASPTGSSYDLYQKLSNGVSNPELLLHSESAWADDWSADGRYLLYQNVDPKTSVDSWILPLFGERKPLPFVRTPAAEMMAHFSPDRRWIAYVSDETGRAEVFVRPFPSLGGGKWQISTGGGQQPRWNRDGKELFYIADDRKLMSVNLELGETFEADTPSALFQTNLIPNTYASYFYWERNQYLATADGKRFLLESAVNDQITSPVTVILNWPTLIK